MNEEDIITFGVHKGKKLKDIPIGYLQWLDAQDWVEKFNPGVYAYIQTDLVQEEIWEYAEYKDEAESEAYADERPGFY